MPFEPDQDLPPPHPDFDGRRMKSSPSLFAKIARWWCPRSVTLETPACTVSRYALRLINKTDGKGYSLDEILAYLAGVTSVAGKTGVVTLEIEDVQGLAAALGGIESSPHGIEIETVENEGEGWTVGGTIPDQGKASLVAAPLVGSVIGNFCWSDDGTAVETLGPSDFTPAFTGTWRIAAYRFEAEGVWVFAYKVGGDIHYYVSTDAVASIDLVTVWDRSTGTEGYPVPTGDPAFTAYSSEGTTGTAPGQIVRRTTDGKYFIRRPGAGPIRYDSVR